MDFLVKEAYVKVGSASLFAEPTYCASLTNSITSTSFLVKEAYVQVSSACIYVALTYYASLYQKVKSRLKIFLVKEAYELVGPKNSGSTSCVSYILEAIVQTKTLKWIRTSTVQPFSSVRCHHQ